MARPHTNSKDRNRPCISLPCLIYGSWATDPVLASTGSDLATVDEVESVMN